jgi:hypothetical protein
MGTLGVTGGSADSATQMNAVLWILSVVMKPLNVRLAIVCGGVLLCVRPMHDAVHSRDLHCL